MNYYYSFKILNVSQPWFVLTKQLRFSLGLCLTKQLRFDKEFR
jgi:hypothetical protein